jgi:hypothetical protein
MTSGTSVVTPERYASGIPSFSAWMEAIPERHSEFQRHYDEYTPNANDIAAVRKLVEDRGVKALVLGEHWCPDVWRGIPVIARIAEGTGMEVRYFARDENKDIMAEFLNQGEFESIPTIVFYDGDHNYLGHWIERPKLANEEMVDLRKILQDAPQEDGPERQEAQAKYREATWAAAPQWRDASLTEMRELIENGLR